MDEKLKRYNQHKMLAGVCAGLATYWGVDVSWIRVFFLLAFVAGCFGGLLYIVLWIAVPSDGRINLHANSANTADMVSHSASDKKKDQGDTRLTFGIALIVLGVVFLLQEFELLPFWFDLSKLWPLAIIIPGVIMLIRPASKKRNHPKDDNDVNHNQSSNNI